MQERSTIAIFTVPHCPDSQPRSQFCPYNKISPRWVKGKPCETLAATAQFPRPSLSHPSASSGEPPPPRFLSAPGMVFFSFADATVAAAAGGDCRGGWQTDKQGRRLEVKRGARLLALLRVAADGATEILLALQDVLRPVSFPSRSAEFFTVGGTVHACSLSVLACTCCMWMWTRKMTLKHERLLEGNERKRLVRFQ